MYDYQRNYFQGHKWSFDGHGLNRDGQRIAKMSECGTLPTHVETDKGMQRNPEYDAIGEGLAELCHAVDKGVSLLPSQSNRPPSVLFEIDEETIADAALGVHVAAVVVKRKDGKVARFHVSLHTSNGRVKCSLTTNNGDRDTYKTVLGRFLD